MTVTASTVDFPRAIAAWAVAWVVGGGLLGAAVLAALGGSSGEPLTPIRLAAVASVGWATMLIAVVAVARSAGTDTLTAVGLRGRIRPRDLWAAPAGVVTQLVVVPGAYLPLRAIWPETFAPERLSDTARDLVDAAAGAGLVLLALVVVVGAPLVEEIVYRGLLQRSLASRVGGPSSVLLTSALFALIHLRWVEFPGLLLAGLLFGLALQFTDRLGPAIIAHAAFNLTGLITVFVTG
jgi:membrane protease YdiL (CAAX protease family)